MPAPYVPQDGDPVILLIALAGFITLFCVGYVAGRYGAKRAESEKIKAAETYADGMERAGAEQAKRADENYTALIAARAAHAEAMELLRKMDAMLPYVARDPAVLKHLEKHGGGK